MNNLEIILKDKKGEILLIKEITKEIDKKLSYTQTKHLLVDELISVSWKIIPELNYREIDKLFADLFDLKCTDKVNNYYIFTDKTFKTDGKDDYIKSRVVGLLEDGMEEESYQSELKFRSNWEWLMTAVDYINSFKVVKIVIGPNCTSIANKFNNILISKSSFPNSFLNTYHALVQLLKQYDVKGKDINELFNK